ASALLAEQLATLIIAVSHKHTRLPIPYRKGETVSCLSWGSFSDLIGEPKNLERMISSVPSIEFDRRLQRTDQRAVRYE
ncbi:hypothetical protein IZT72_18115, partial [Pseudomonas brenneri]|uniref:hypothetical protein n=1 Tax=Pseudomonas brenneri TaxID=129817 RepID=UPI0018A2DA1E